MAKTKSDRPGAPLAPTLSPFEQFFDRGDRDGWPPAKFTREELVDVIREDRDSGHRD